MTEAARIAENPAPYDVLTARVALVEAAKLNKDAISYATMDVESNTEFGEYLEHAGALATVAQSLSTYALALSRWNT